MSKNQLDTLINHVLIKETFHSSRTLNDHLKGTYQLLKLWGNTKSVCFAGLFHSVYGTNYFKTKTLEITERKKIITLIGRKAERLVYLFCLLKEESFFKNAEIRNNYIIQLQNGECIEIKLSVYKNLVEIAYANFIEQFPHIKDRLSKAILVELMEKWATLHLLVSENARQAFMQMLSKIFEK
jgi:hypothetical protein